MKENGMVSLLKAMVIVGVVISFYIIFKANSFSEPEAQRLVEGDCLLHYSADFAIKIVIAPSVPWGYKKRLIIGPGSKVVEPVIYDIDDFQHVTPRLCDQWDKGN